MGRFAALATTVGRSRARFGLAIALGLLARGAVAGSLVTPGYIITITANCEEGVVVCDDVVYRGVSRRSGKAIELRGRDVFRYCPEDHGDGPGGTPCHHLGYEFRGGSVTYFVGDNGALVVTDGDRVLLSEQGEWE
ncbi:MAG: hypothetical protein AB7Q97_05190 [Gammaproteobacteria bacterium]